MLLVPITGKEKHFYRLFHIFCSVWMSVHFSLNRSSHGWWMITRWYIIYRYFENEIPLDKSLLLRILVIQSPPPNPGFRANGEWSFLDAPKITYYIGVLNMHIFGRSYINLYIFKSWLGDFMDTRFINSLMLTLIFRIFGNYYR